MKKKILTGLVLLAFIATSGCGARRRIIMATARAQALTATTAPGAPTATASTAPTATAAAAPTATVTSTPAATAAPAPTATAAPASTDTAAAPTATAMVLFQDDFEDDQPDDWHITASWTVRQEGDDHVFGSSAYGGAWVPQGFGWSDYELQAVVRATAGGVILSYRVTHEGRYLLHLREDGMYLSREYPIGTYTTLTQAAAPSQNAWHQVTVAGYGGHLQVYVDRELQLDYVDPSPVLQGTIGVSTLDGYQATVDDVLVTRLTILLPTPESAMLPPTVPPPTPLSSEGAGLPLEDVPPVATQAPPLEEAPAAGLPVIDYFESQPSERAECYYLHWDLHDATAAYLNNAGIVAPSSQEVCPQDTGIYVYTLRADNQAGSTEATITFEASMVPPEEEPVPEEDLQPDLAIGGVEIWSPMPSEPQAVLVQIEVRNIGDGPAGALTVRWHPHQDTDEVGCSINLAGLSADSSQILSPCSYTYPGHGEMTWRAVVDADNNIQNEMHEDNNEMGGTVYIEGGEE